jgi:hypothetical protein
MLLARGWLPYSTVGSVPEPSTWAMMILALPELASWRIGGSRNQHRSLPDLVKDQFSLAIKGSLALSVSLISHNALRL